MSQESPQKQSKIQVAEYQFIKIKTIYLLYINSKIFGILFRIFSKISVNLVFA